MEIPVCDDDHSFAYAVLSLFRDTAQKPSGRILGESCGRQKAIQKRVRAFQSKLSGWNDWCIVAEQRLQQIICKQWVENVRSKLILALTAAAVLFQGCGMSTTSSAGNPSWDSSAVIDLVGLQWLVGPDRDMNWNEAKEWVDVLGEGWRMPSTSQLRCLNVVLGINSDNWESFQNSGLHVWSGQIRCSESSWIFSFDRNGDRRAWALQDDSTFLRAFAVRPYPIDLNNLQWLSGPDWDITWYEANDWVQGLGGGWRLPSIEELQGLWDAGIRLDNSWPFTIYRDLPRVGRVVLRVWSGEVIDSTSAWTMSFMNGRPELLNCDGSVRGFFDGIGAAGMGLCNIYRTIAVRSQ